MRLAAVEPEEAGLHGTMLLLLVQALAITATLDHTNAPWRRGCGRRRERHRPQTKHALTRHLSREEVVWITGSTHSGDAIWLHRGPAREC